MNLVEVNVHQFSSTGKTDDSLKVINRSYVICIEPGVGGGASLFLKDYGWLYSDQSYEAIRDIVLGRTDIDRSPAATKGESDAG